MSENFSALSDCQDGRVSVADARAADCNEKIKGGLFKFGGYGGGAARSGVSECHFGAGVSCAFLDEMRCFDVAIGCWNIDQAQLWPPHLHLFELGCVCKYDVQWTNLHAGDNKQAIREIHAASAPTVPRGGFCHDLRDRGRLVDTVG